MHEMNVQAIAMDGKSQQPIVILSDQSRTRALPIWIGLAEASAIARALKETKNERPLTHDLLVNSILELGYEVDRLEISEIVSQTYFARLCLTPKDGSDKTKSIDCRPSDGIAVAMISGAPILVSPGVYDEATVPINLDPSEEEDEEFKKFVEEVKPADFARLLAEKSTAGQTADVAEADVVEPDTDESGPASESTGQDGEGPAEG